MLTPGQLIKPHSLSHFYPPGSLKPPPQGVTLTLCEGVCTTGRVQSAWGGDHSCSGICPTVSAASLPNMGTTLAAKFGQPNLFKPLDFSQGGGQLGHR